MAFKEQDKFIIEKIKGAKGMPHRRCFIEAGHFSQENQPLRIKINAFASHFRHLNVYSVKISKMKPEDLNNLAEHFFEKCPTEAQTG